MLSMKVWALRIIDTGDIDEIPGCKGYTCWPIDAPDRENKTQEEMEK
jgi:hypothetical protein